MFVHHACFDSWIEVVQYKNILTVSILFLLIITKSNTIYIYIFAKVILNMLISLTYKSSDDIQHSCGVLFLFHAACADV